jgi:hypothetical protein
VSQALIFTQTQDIHVLSTYFYLNFYRRNLLPFNLILAPWERMVKAVKQQPHCLKQAVKVDKDHIKSIATEKWLRKGGNHHQKVIADNPNKVTVPCMFAEKRVKAQAQWMVDMMEMMNDVVDKQGWFGSIQMDQEFDLTATHVHQQQQRLFEGKFLNIGHLMLNNKELHVHALSCNQMWGTVPIQLC